MTSTGLNRPYLTWQPLRYSREGFKLSVNGTGNTDMEMRAAFLLGNTPLWRRVLILRGTSAICSTWNVQNRVDIDCDRGYTPMWQVLPSNLRVAPPSRRENIYLEGSQLPCILSTLHTLTALACELRLRSYAPSSAFSLLATPGRSLPMAIAGVVSVRNDI